MMLTDRNTRPARPRGWASSESSGRTLGEGSPEPIALAIFMLEHVTRGDTQLVGDGRERGAFHLTKLDGEHLEQVSIGVRGCRTPTFRRVHQLPGDIEANGTLRGGCCRRGIDRTDGRGLENRRRER